jgi:hypothetical protein
MSSEMENLSANFRLVGRTVISTPNVNGSVHMKKLAIVFAASAAALLGGSAANAADNTVKAKAATDVTQSSTSSTDISSRRRYRHYGYRHYRPYYRSYGYAPAAVLWIRPRLQWAVLWRRLRLWRAECKLLRRWVPRLVMRKARRSAGFSFYGIELSLLEAIVVHYLLSLHHL